MAAALWAVRRPTKRGLMNAVVVFADGESAARTAAAAVSASVTSDWDADLLTDLIGADSPARVFGAHGLVLHGERTPGK
jgi:hypothetical protein